MTEPADLIARARARYVAGGDALLGELADALEGAQAALVSSASLIGGLFCPACKAQGRDMASVGKCCRDIDCDAGFYGINCDEVKHVLEEIEAVSTGTAQDEKDDQP